MLFFFCFISWSFGHPIVPRLDLGLHPFILDANRAQWLTLSPHQSCSALPPLRSVSTSPPLSSLSRWPWPPRGGSGRPDGMKMRVAAVRPLLLLSASPSRSLPLPLPLLSPLSLSPCRRIWPAGGEEDASHRRASSSPPHTASPPPPSPTPTPSCKL